MRTPRSVTCCSLLVTWNTFPDSCSPAAGDVVIAAIADVSNPFTVCQTSQGLGFVTSFS